MAIDVAKQESIKRFVQAVGVWYNLPTGSGENPESLGEYWERVKHGQVLPTRLTKVSLDNETLEFKCVDSLAAGNLKSYLGKFFREKSFEISPKKDDGPTSLDGSSVFFDTSKMDEKRLNEFSSLVEQAYAFGLKNDNLVKGGLVVSGLGSATALFGSGLLGPASAFVLAPMSIIGELGTHHHGMEDAIRAKSKTKKENSAPIEEQGKAHSKLQAASVEYWKKQAAQLF